MSPSARLSTISTVAFNGHFNLADQNRNCCAIRPPTRGNSRLPHRLQLPLETGSALRAHMPASSRLGSIPHVAVISII